MKLQELNINESLLDEKKFKGRHQSLLISNAYRNSYIAALNLNTQLTSIPKTKDNMWEINYMLKQTNDLIDLLQINLDTAVTHVRRRKIGE